MTDDTNEEPQPLILSADALDALASALGAALDGCESSVATAESCTGGWVSQAITAIAGSSKWFDRGFVTYSNEAKREMLGVRVHSLRKFGAVSEKVVQEMALGAVKKSNAEFSVAISGIAGPGGGTEDKPVGTVWFAWANGTDVESSVMQFPGDREQVRLGAACVALQGLVSRLPDWLKNEKKSQPDIGES
ncbi:MAG: nicotinamide-nucleotide amidase [Pseudomonadales bacterium]|nr:nicotinamide-nucleotide amidase [Pseudomonadales bacterium]